MSIAGATNEDDPELIPTAMVVATPLSVVGQEAPRAMVVVDEGDLCRTESPPHGRIGTSTAYRIGDAVLGRTMEFRKRVRHPGAAIGLHPLAHDEIYFVLSGEGEVRSDADTRRLTTGMAAYLYCGATVGIRQIGQASLVLIIS